jgi:Uma2 family endonuclease
VCEADAVGAVCRECVSKGSLPSLREYGLIDAEKRSVDVYRLGDQGLWGLHPADMAVEKASVHFASVDCTIKAEQMFADV